MFQAQYDDVDMAAEREGLAIAAHRRMTCQRPVTRGDCKRKGLVRGCQAAKDRTRSLATPLAVKVSHGIKLGDRHRLSRLVEV